MVLSCAGVAFVAITKSEKQISGNAVISTTAFYNAEAGITEGLYRMSFPKDTASYMGPVVGPFPGWGRYIVLASGASALDPDRAALASDGLDNNGNLLVDESGEHYPEIPSKQTGADKLAYPYVRVEYKTQGGQLVRFGDADQNPATPPVENTQYGAPMLHIMASGRRGAAQKVIEADAVRFPLLSVDAAIWAGGPLGFNGNAFLIDGHDHHMTVPYDTIPGAAPVQAVLTKGPTTDATLTQNQQDNVTGMGGDASVAQSTFTYDFNALLANLSAMADHSFTGDQSFSSGTPNYGTPANPQVTVVKGNLAAQGTWFGSGILMVDGNLDMGGGSMFNGIVICTGDVHLAGGGPADIARILGGIIFQGSLINSSTLGGSGRVFYSTEAVNNALSLQRYTLAWWRER
jgi:hypothetical protein